MRKNVEGLELVDELSKMMDDLPKSEEAREARPARGNGVEILCSMAIVDPE